MSFELTTSRIEIPWACLASNIRPAPPSSNGIVPPPTRLTLREAVILERLGYGESNKLIGRKLGVSPNTVKFHLKNLFSKLGVCSRQQALAAAQALGWIGSPDIAGADSQVRA